MGFKRKTLIIFTTNMRGVRNYFYLFFVIFQKDYCLKPSRENIALHESRISLVDGNIYDDAEIWEDD